jgi:hypothetical protein
MPSTVARRLNYGQLSVKHVNFQSLTESSVNFQWLTDSETTEFSQLSVTKGVLIKAFKKVFFKIYNRQ